MKAPVPVIPTGSGVAEVVIPASRAKRDNGGAGPKGERVARVKRESMVVEAGKAKVPGFPRSQE